MDLHFLIFPVSVVFYQLYKTFYGLAFGYAFQDTCPVFVEVDFALSGANVAIVGVGHFAGAIYDAPHDGYFQSFQMRSCGFYAGDGCLQVVKRTPQPGQEMYSVRVMRRRVACRIP